MDLQFGGLVNIGEYKDIVAGIIFEDAPRFRYMNNLGHLVGDLLVFYDSWEYILHGKYTARLFLCKHFLVRDSVQLIYHTSLDPLNLVYMDAIYNFYSVACIFFLQQL